MKRLSVTSILVIIAGLAFLGNPHPDIFNQNPNPEEENLENVIRSYQVASGKKTFNHPTSIYPVYLKMLHDISASERQRDILKFTIAKASYRENRERKFLRFNSSSNGTSKLKLPIPKPTVYNITIIPKKVVKVALPEPEPLIMVRNLTKVFGGRPLTTGNLFSKEFPRKNVTRTSISNVSNEENNTAKAAEKSTDKYQIFNETKKQSDTKPPPDPILPPTGDVTEEEYDEEEDEEDDVQSDKESKENDKDSKENDESSEEEDNQSDQRTSKETSKEITKVEEKAEPPKVSSVPLPPQKGDTGSTEVNDDKSAKKRSKKKKKKKKKAKKAHLHFAPAPLGPKADLIFRLDKVHKNVREIFSVFKGVLTDYVVKRPHVNIEFYNKGEIPPFPKGWNKEEKGKDRSDFSSYALDSRSQQAPPWNPSKWRKKYPKNEKPDEISKRFGLEDCADDDEKCDEQPSVSEVDEKPGSNSKPQTLVRLPYPIYMESGDDEEYSPFDDLPPLSSSYFKPEEKTWVKTWDKKKTGLPKIADSKEASKRVKHKNIRDY